MTEEQKPVVSDEIDDEVVEDVDIYDGEPDDIHRELENGAQDEEDEEEEDA